MWKDVRFRQPDLDGRHPRIAENKFREIMQTRFDEIDMWAVRNGDGQVLVQRIVVVAITNTQRRPSRWRETDFAAHGEFLFSVFSWSCIPMPTCITTSVTWAVKTGIRCVFFTN